MPTTFPSCSLSLAALFNRATSLTVPSFQRPYSWSVKEAGQLLEDLVAAASDDVEQHGFDYFLGTILILCDQPHRLLGDGARPDDGGACEVIDGQQRLATLTILAAVLRDLTDDPASPLRGRLDDLIGSGDVLKLRLHDREQAFLAGFVLAPGSCADMPTDESQLVPSEKAILAAREHFMAELSHLPPVERQRLANYLLDHCQLVVIATDDIDRAHRMFVVLNGRGRPLQREDILKAEIAQNLPRERAGEIMARWDRVALRLGSRFETLFAHIRTIHGDTRPQIITAIRGIVTARGGAERFVSADLEPLGEALAAISNPWDESTDLSMETRRRLVYLNRLAGTEWVPAVMLSLRQRHRAPERAEQMIAGIDRLAHVLRFLCMGGGKRQGRFSAAIRAIADDAANVDMLLQPTREDLRVVQFNLRDLHARAPSMCKLLLMRLEDETNDLLPAHDPGDFSVEHVLPSRPPPNSAWRTVIPDPNERAACTHSLGNLVLVTPKQNDRARNEDFDRKLAVYQTPELGRPILTTTREVIAHESWTAADIRAREARMMAMIARMWDLPLAPTIRESAAA